MAEDIPLKGESGSEAERLTNEILDVILSLAALDFTKTVRVGYEDSSFNAVAAGLNMLGQELQHSVVSKEKLQDAHDDLERQVQERTKELSKALDQLYVEIDERKRAEAEALAREERFRNIFETTSVSIWETEISNLMVRLASWKGKSNKEISALIDNDDLVIQLLNDLEIIDVNQATLSMFEVNTQDEFIVFARHMLSSIESRPMFKELVTVMVDGKSFFEYELVPKTNKGKIIHLLFQICILKKPNAKQQGLVSIIDITKQRELEQQLRQSQKMEAIGQLAGGVAHDFNNLLTVILSYGELVAEELKDNDQTRKRMDAIIECAERAASLTKQLLSFSRRQVIEEHVLDINSVVQGMEKMLHRLIGEDVNLETKLEQGLGNVVADKGLVEQIVMNLVVNARDAMPKGGKIHVETSNIDFTGNEKFSGEFVKLSVADTGVGMSSETVSHIFEPFFTTKGVGKGTGLGLSTVYGNVSQVGGHIDVESELNVGTTFNIFLPRVAKGTDDVEVKADSNLELEKVSETIFVVEDDENVRGAACSILRQHGYKVIEASSPMQALSISEQSSQHLDLLVTDVIMPGMNGVDLAEKIKIKRPTLPVLFVSGYTNNAVLEQGVLSHDIPFLQKPFVPKSLLQKVREVLDANNHDTSN